MIIQEYRIFGESVRILAKTCQYIDMSGLFRMFFILVVVQFGI